MAGSVILRQRIVPRSLAVLAADAVREGGGDQWALSGQMLFGAPVHGREVFCVVEPELNVGALMFSGFSGPGRGFHRQDCFEDSDNDGAFDTRYNLNPGSGALPLLGDQRLLDPAPLSPAAFERIPSEQFDPAAWVEVRYERGGTAADPAPVFEIVCHYSDQGREVSTRVSSSANLRTPVSVIGGAFQLRRDENGQIFAEVLSPMNGNFEAFTATMR